MKRKRAIKRSLEAGTPKEQIRKRYKRGNKLLNSVNKMSKEKLFAASQINRGSTGAKKYFSKFYFVIFQNIESSFGGSDDFFGKSL